MLAYIDHALIHCTYSSQSQITHPKFVYILPNHLLTKNWLNAHINNCTQLNNIFSITDPDLISNEILINFNYIINLIEPLKKVHLKKEYI